VLFGDGHACHIDGICTVHIKMFNETMRELQDVGCVPHLNKNLISVESLEAQGLRGTLTRFQDVQWLISCSERYSTQQLVLHEG